MLLITNREGFITCAMTRAGLASDLVQKVPR